MKLTLRKKRSLTILVFVLACACLLGVSHVAQAQEGSSGLMDYGKNLYNKASSVVTGVGDFIRNPITTTGNAIIGAVLWLFNMFAGFLLGAAISLLDLTTSSILFDQVFFSPDSLKALNTGWGLVRDFVNMFFILILVFLAICTILRVNKYSDKRLLLSVVFAALLVNFSKPITMIIIDASNLAMSFFISNLQSANHSYGSTFLNNMGFSEALSSKFSGADKAKMHVAMLIGIIFKFIMGGMLFFLAAALLVRLVAFWVLIVLSPLAFFAMALPGSFLSQIKDTWVKKMTYWALFGPVMLFFLWLALVMITSLTISIDAAPQKNELKCADLSMKEQGKEFTVGAMGIIIPFLAAIYMLFYGYNLSSSMAATAGSSAAAVLNKGPGFVSRWGKRGAGAMGGAWAYGRYKTMKEGISQREGMPFTKAKREKAQRKREAFWAGESKQHEASVVNDQLKAWDEKGVPSEKEAKGMLSGKDKIKQKAAALRLAKDGKLKSSDDSYARAENVLKDDPKLIQRFRDNAKKHNRHAMIEQDIKRKIEGEEKKLAGRALTSSEKANIKQGEYDEVLKKMTISDITNQDIEFHKGSHFKRYMQKNIGVKGSGRRFDHDFIRKQAASNLDAAREAEWRKAGFLT
ncbi:MAG: hypothetical protein U9M90_01095 [Patescibacteria group bacterium]|nr:hypothetical protein [Patescibacteria group bacterium]